jgi:hypothetical protein
MKKFVVTYLAPLDAAWKTADTSPEEMEKGMKAWMDWAQKCGTKLVDFGTPLGNGVTLEPGGSSVSSESRIIGYSILQADSMEEASELLKEHPHLDWNAACEIEIHESLAVPGT